jgi:1-pyrroline-5-carboxylate dehydrogenase
MTNAIFCLPEARNEPALPYAPKTLERALLKSELDRQYHQELDIPLIIGGQEVRTGNSSTRSWTKPEFGVCPPGKSGQDG